ncbi:MAG: transglycosylase domain-containing protein [Fimbriimonadales bacterium]
MRRFKRALWASVALLLGMFIAFGAYVWVIFNSLDAKVALLPKKQADLRRSPTEILSADGIVLCRLATEMREHVSYQDIPKRIINATIAAEDIRFNQHSGVDLTAIVRAIWTNLRSGSVRQGGSTITQQVAKRLLTTGDRTFRRKIEDACLALQIERKYSKEQIMEIYLNQVYYGAQAYGIKAAADVYFGRPLDELSLSQTALLARLPRRPSDENPFVDMEAAKANRDVVLQIMLEENMIEPDDQDRAMKERVRLVSAKPIRGVGIKHSPYFVTWVLEALRDRFPNEDYARGGYKVYTTLNYKAQVEVEDAVEATIRRNRHRRVTEGAMVVIDTNGEVVAMVGGLDFNRSQYNIITQGHRQPGSSFKPFVYATALELGTIHPNSSVSNARIAYRDPSSGRVWRPKGGGRGGSMSLRSAFINSVNIPAIHVNIDVGPENVARFAKDVFGFRSELFPGPALALGSSAVSPLEMAQAYSVFATGGNRATPYGIRRVVGPEGTIVADFRPLIAPNVLSGGTAETLRDLMRGVVTSGTGTAAGSVRNASGKTGTTNSYQDAWFCGFTDNLIGIAWVANATYDPDSTPAWKYGRMDGVMGGKVSAVMWANAIGPVQRMFDGRPTPARNTDEAQMLTQDVGDTIRIRVCSESGLRARRSCSSVRRAMGRDQIAELGWCDLGHPRQSRVREADPNPEPDPDPGPPEDAGPPDAPAPPNARDDPSARPPTARRPAANVSVEICVETGLRATTYCRLKRLQKFRRDSEPMDTCHVHRP